MHRYLALLGLVGLLAGCALTREVDLDRAEPYVTFALASEHVAAEQDFVETNPGVGLGAEVQVGTRPILVGGELGVFRNSFDETTPYLVGFTEGTVGAPWSEHPLGLGVFYGYGRYPGEADRARDRGFVVIGDFIPIGGLQVTVPTIRNNALRFRIVPGLLEDTASVIAIQTNFRF